MVQGLGLRAWGLGNCLRISDKIFYEGFYGDHSTVLFIPCFGLTSSLAYTVTKLQELSMPHDSRVGSCNITPMS